MSGTSRVNHYLCLRHIPEENTSTPGMVWVNVSNNQIGNIFRFDTNTFNSIKNNLG